MVNVSTGTSLGCKAHNDSRWTSVGMCSSYKMNVGKPLVISPFNSLIHPSRNLVQAQRHMYLFDTPHDFH